MEAKIIDVVIGDGGSPNQAKVRVCWVVIEELGN